MKPSDPFPHPDWSRPTHPAYWWGRADNPFQPLLPSAEAQRAARLANQRVVIVCGGPDYSDWERVWAALDRVHEEAQITLLVHGASVDPKTAELQGTDRWTDAWAGDRSVRREPRPADSTTWGARAESMRNKQMAAAGAHGCIAFPGGDETARVVRQALAHGIPVWRPFG